MDKQVTLIAKTLVAYGGRTYGENMQFVVPEDVAARFIAAKQADIAPVKKTQASAQAVDPAAGPTTAAE